MASKRKQQGARRSAKAVRSRGSITERGKGTYLLRVYRGTDEGTGHRKYHNETVKGTRRDAEKALTRILRELDTCSYVPVAKQSLEEYLRHWLENVARYSMSGRTLSDHTRNLERYVFPVLGNAKLGRVTVPQIEALYAGMRGRGLSPRTVRLTHAPLRQALKHAVVSGVLSRNPAEHVTLPKQERKEPQVLTPEEVCIFLDGAKGDRWYALWVLLLTTGMRAGEALALRWSDWNGGVIRVKNALTRTAPGAV
jgi:integrase